jgi:hypothetical protein
MSKPTQLDATGVQLRRLFCCYEGAIDLTNNSYQ